MTKRFVIGTDPLTRQQTEAVRAALKGAGWWHWLPNMWLVKDSSDKYSVESINKLIAEASPFGRCIVLEVEPKTWAAMSKPDTKGREMTAWLEETWDADSTD